MLQQRTHANPLALNMQYKTHCAGGSIWERIVKHKLPVVEPRDSADFPTAAQDFRDKLNDPSASGAIFLAVCRCPSSSSSPSYALNGHHC